MKGKRPWVRIFDRFTSGAMSFGLLECIIVALVAVGISIAGALDSLGGP